MYVSTFPQKVWNERSVRQTEKRLFIFRVDTSEKWNVNGDEECATTAWE
jgi:hypothetical protein